MPADITKYLDLVTSQHKDKLKFIASLSEAVQPFADLADLDLSMITLFDVDTAVGDQLDKLGEWIGQGRELEGATLTTLTVAEYRRMLKAKILANHQENSNADVYAIFNKFFEGTGYTFFLVDPTDLTMSLGVLGAAAVDATTLKIFTGRYIPVKPAGVRLRSYITQSVPNYPIFSFDLDTVNFKGFDQSAWATITSGDLT